MNLTDKKIINIALPSIVSNITVPLLGLIDVAIVGHLGAAEYIGNHGLWIAFLSYLLTRGIVLTVMRRGVWNI